MASQAITEYLEQGFDHDLARWLEGRPTVSLHDTALAVDGFAARLDAGTARKLRAIDARVRARTLPTLWLLDMAGEGAYGFDFVANGATFMDDEGNNVAADVWALGLDGSGNYWVLRTSGEVVLWCPTAGDILDAATRFSGLDAFFWAVVRRAALQSGKLDIATVEAEIKGLDEPGLKEVIGTQFGRMRDD